MTQESRHELEILRRRAYGPHADIHLDSQAVDRLRELEGRSRRSLEPVSPRDPEIDSTAPEAVPREESHEATTIVEPGAAKTQWEWAHKLLRYLSRVRRSTALIVLSFVVAVVLGVIALALVQRVQTDPLQVGAEQIARLSIDASYEIPQFFDYAIGDSTPIEAFEEFYGLRTVAVLGTGSWFYNGGSGDCMSIFPAENMKPDSSSFSGLLLGGCAAGDFPAMTQISVAAEGLPEELRSAFPDSAAFQFVLDTDNQEIVVFLTD